MNDMAGLDAWAAMGAISAGLAKVYTGIEDAMLVVCKELDGVTPEGSKWHQDLLEQLVVPRKAMRPALLSDALFNDLVQLKKFRQFAAHSYAVDLDREKLLESVDRLNRVVPDLITRFIELDAAITAPDETPGKAVKVAKDPFSDRSFGPDRSRSHLHISVQASEAAKARGLPTGLFVYPKMRTAT
ncbi:hypothetical protein ACEUZ9_001105 [Paracoccus litorisediminis]|uniref:ribonuclease toxin HepT-like protein n=1 Tax=Paracoccus litorisediminis TaxID=2006130 RepID=UPI003731351B